MGSGRLAYQHLDGDEDQPVTKRRKGASSRIEKPRGVAYQFKQTDVSDVEKVIIMARDAATHLRDQATKEMQLCCYYIVTIAMLLRPVLPFTFVT